MKSLVVLLISVFASLSLAGEVGVNAVSRSAFPSSSAHPMEMPEALCLKVTLKMQPVPVESEKFYCSNLRSEAQAICVSAALQIREIKRGTEKAYCSAMQSVAVARCVASALDSSVIKFGQEKSYCSGVQNEAQGICYSAALGERRLVGDICLLPDAQHKRRA